MSKSKVVAAGNWSVQGSWVEYMLTHQSAVEKFRSAHAAAMRHFVYPLLKKQMKILLREISNEGPVASLVERKPAVLFGWQKEL